MFLLGALFAGGASLFHPALYAFILGVLVFGAIEIGRILAERYSLRRCLVRTGLPLVFVLAAVPAARVIDHAYLDSLARAGGEVEYQLPGISVRATTVAVAPGAAVAWAEFLPEDRAGTIHSRSRAGTERTQLVTVWHRLPSSPPYELILPLLTASLAVASHRLRRYFGPNTA